MSSLREIIIKYNNKFIDWVVSRPLRREKDPEKHFEINLWLEITGALIGGQGGDGAWEKYKIQYYDKLSDEEKKRVQSCLMDMLKSDRYNLSNKAFIAQVCADLYLKEAIPILDDLLRNINDPRDIKSYKLAYEGLSRGISMHELVEEKFRRGERL